MGGALGKGLLRALGAVVGGALGLAALVLADLIAHQDWDIENPGARGLAPAAIVCISVLGFLITVHRQRFRQIEHFFFVMLYTVPVVLGSGIR